MPRSIVAVCGMIADMHGTDDDGIPAQRALTSTSAMAGTSAWSVSNAISRNNTRLLVRLLIIQHYYAAVPPFDYPLIGGFAAGRIVLRIGAVEGDILDGSIYPSLTTTL